MDTKIAENPGAVTPAAETAAERLVAAPEFLAELAAESQRLETATPEAIIRWAADRFGSKLAMATAFGPEGCVILYLLSRVQPDTYVFNLDTGYQFTETLELRDRIAEKYGIEVEMKRPPQTVAEYEAAHGGPLYVSQPDKCCHDRKVVVLHQAIKGMHAWMSGIRRDQSPDRAAAPIIGWDSRFQLVKVSPLANMTKSEIWKLILSEEIPYNLLHDKGYPSIGCQPCTKAVLFGEDERSGRWSGSAKTECGLHSVQFEQGGGI